MGTLVPDTMSSPPQRGRLGLAVGCITKPTEDNRRQKIQNLYSLRGWSRRRDRCTYTHIQALRASAGEDIYKKQSRRCRLLQKEGERVDSDGREPIERKKWHQNG